MSIALPAAILAAAHLFFTVLLLIWNIYIAARIVSRRDVSPALATLSGFGGLLIAPAVLVISVSGSMITGRTLVSVNWLWPLAALLMCSQAVFATVKGLVPRSTGAIITMYDLLLLAIATVRWLVLVGLRVPDPLLALSAAQALAMEIGASSIATPLPMFLYIPLLAPAVPPRHRSREWIMRGAATALAGIWTVLILLSMPPGMQAIDSYAQFSNDRLQERPAGDFEIGVSLFPTISGRGPPDISVIHDVTLAREMQARVIAISIAPGSVSEAMLDSVTNSVEAARRAGAHLVLTLAVPDEAARGSTWSERWKSERAKEMDLLLRTLRPEYFVPAQPRSYAPHRVPLSDWKRYLAFAAATSHHIRPRTSVIVPLTGFTSRDSAIYSWASSREAQVDAIGFTFTPGVRGGTSLDAQLKAADRWIRDAALPREHWVLRASGWPTIHGERSQELALWKIMAWASRHSRMRGVIVSAASDYGGTSGLRSAGGRLRPAARRVASAISAEAAAQERVDSPPIEP